MPSLCSIVQNSFRDQRAVLCTAAPLHTKHSLLLFATYLPYTFLEIVLQMLKKVPEHHVPAPSNHSYLPVARVPYSVRLRGCTEQELPPAAGTQAEDQLLYHLGETKRVSSLLKRESVSHTLMSICFRKNPSPI